MFNVLLEYVDSILFHTLVYILKQINVGSQQLPFNLF